MPGWEETHFTYARWLYWLLPQNCSYGLPLPRGDRRQPKVLFRSPRALGTLQDLAVLAWRLTGFNPEQRVTRDEYFTWLREVLELSDTVLEALLILCRLAE